MARPKGDQPPREYINARIRKELFDALTERTENGNPSRSQAVEKGVEMWLAANGGLPAPAPQPTPKPRKKP